MSEGTQVAVAFAVGSIHAFVVMHLMFRVRTWLRPVVVVTGYAVLIGGMWAIDRMAA